MKIKPLHIALCSLFAAITAVFSQIAIPIGPVPINLATFSVLCSGLILGSRMGALSQIIYVLIGAVGAPVFSMMRGGFGIILGPTGGYIIGYIIAAFVSGIIAEKRNYRLLAILFSLFVGYLAYTIPGLVWYMAFTGSPLTEALYVCFFPFIIGDLCKIILCFFIIPKLRTAIVHSNLI